MSTHDTSPVINFMRSFAGGIDSIESGLDKYCTENVLWESSGFPTVEGRDAAKGMLRDAHAVLEFGPIYITPERMTTTDTDCPGDYLVWVWRVDDIQVTPLTPEQDPDGRWADPDGDGWASIAEPVGSIYKVSGGKVAEIRERWDPSSLHAYGAARSS